MTSTRPRIALAHDWLVGYRGGEAVLERLAALIDTHFEPAGLFTMFDDQRALAPSIDAWRSRGLIRAIHRTPAACRVRRWLLPRYPAYVNRLSSLIAAEHRERPIDLVLSTSSAAIKGLRPPAGVPHLCYCHSPARYIWSQREEYSLGRSLPARARAAGLAMIARRYQAWDRQTASHVTHFIANSTHTAAQIHAAYQRDARVIVPPVRTAFFTPGPERARERFWLVVSALEPYKRVDLAIAAAILAGAELRIAGSGSQRAELERLARHRANIHFLGRPGDTRLRELYRSAGVLLFPQIEDFGIIAAEAQACGCPVVARAAGGALDIIEPGVTGLLVRDATAAALAEACRETLARSWNAGAIRARCVERCAEDVFDRAMLDAINAALAAPPPRINTSSPH